jgi:uncharacterized membrane protein YoaK (UPF0700 family)
MDLVTYSYFSGLITMGYFIAGVFFLRFWRRTSDSLFVIFACAFLLLALTQAVLALAGIIREEQSWIYLIRLVAFLLIIVGIVRKNYGRGRR